MMASLLTHPLTKGLFLGAAVLAGITAVFAYSDEVVLALESLPASNVLAAGIASVGYVVATMCCWRAILHDLGSPLSTAHASRLFFVSQLGKYIPGGVWSVVAVGEMGRERGVPRRSSFGSMLIFWGVSVTTGLAVGATYAVAARAQIAGGWLWVTATLVLGLALLSPPVLRKLLRI